MAAGLHPRPRRLWAQTPVKSRILVLPREQRREGTATACGNQSGEVVRAPIQEASGPIEVESHSAAAILAIYDHLPPISPPRTSLITLLCLLPSAAQHSSRFTDTTVPLSLPGLGPADPVVHAMPTPWPVIPTLHPAGQFLREVHTSMRRPILTHGGLARYGSRDVCRPPSTTSKLKSPPDDRSHAHPPDAPGRR